ncbi:hypothetical protein GGR51DRAFT_564410 [Nemania sp. FL0031]|nr:hypothetical protein GGR51DRAFT_564410 [Nemania sp. FL0031]
MYSPALLAGAFTVSAVAAAPHTPLPNMTEVRISMPSFLMSTSLFPSLAPASGSPPHSSDLDLHLRCLGIGPQCMDIYVIPPDKGPLAVRVYCSAVPKPPGYQDGKPNDFIVRPTMMYPCPDNSSCRVELAGPQMASSLLRPLPYARSAASDAWRFFENEKSVVPGLETEDTKGWIQLDGLIREVEEGDDGDDKGDDNDGNDNDDDDDDKGEHGMFTIPLPLTAVASSSPLDDPEQPWFKFTCYNPGNGTEVGN